MGAALHGVTSRDCHNGNDYHVHITYVRAQPSGIAGFPLRRWRSWDWPRVFLTFNTMSFPKKILLPTPCQITERK